MNRSIQKLTFLVLITLFVFVLATSWDASISASLTPNKAPLQAETLANSNIVTSKTAILDGISTSESLPTNESVLPDFIWAAIVQMNPNASSAELAQIRAQTINQLMLNQERIDDTNGGVLNCQSWRNSRNDIMSQNAKSENAAYEETTYDYSIGSLSWNESAYGGHVFDNTSVVGYVDNSFTELYTPLFWYPGHDQVSGRGQMASDAGEIWTSQASGDFYVVAKLGSHVGTEPNSTNGNYLLFWTAITPNREIEHYAEYWTLLGFVKITAPFNSAGSAYYVGTAYSAFNYMSVGVMNMGGVCTYNDVMADCVLGISFEPSPSTYHHLYTSSSGNGEAWPMFGLHDFVEGQQVVVSAIPDHGYDFANWTLDGNYFDDSAPALITMDTDHSIVANFKNRTTAYISFYTFAGSIGNILIGDNAPSVYVDGNYSGTTDDNIAVSYGVNHTIAVDSIVNSTEGTCYFQGFGWWPYALGPLTVWNDNPVTIDFQDDVWRLAIYSAFGSDPCQYLTVLSSQGGYAYASGTIFPHDAQVPIYAIPYYGFEFANWTVDGVYAGADNPLTVTMDTDHNVTANFDVFHYVNLQSGLGGTAYVVGGNNRFVNGSQASVSVTNVLDGFVFANWTVDGNYAGTTLPLSLTMDMDHLVVAIFAETSPHHFLTVQSTDGGSASASGSVFIENTQVPVYAYADSGYNFTGWTVDGNFVGTNNPLMVTMDADHVVVANFQYVYTVSFSAISGFGEPWTWFSIGGVDVYVDGVYAGPADGTTFQICAGEHNFTFTDPAYDATTDCWYNYITAFTWSYPYFFTYYPGNPAAINIQSNMDLYTYYDPQT